MVRQICKVCYVAIWKGKTRRCAEPKLWTLVKGRINKRGERIQKTDPIHDKCVRCLKTHPWELSKSEDEDCEEPVTDEKENSDQSAAGLDDEEGASSKAKTPAMDNYSKYAPVKNETNQYQVCCITMNMGDRLRLLACPPEVIPLIRASITSTWGGVQSEKPYHGSHEFKLKGYPWHGQGDDAVSARRLLVGILTVMAKQGWNLIQSTDVSKKEGDKDSLFFERGVEEPDASLFAVSFNMGDRIRIVDAPGFMPYLKQAVTTFWPRGIQNEREYHGSLELKLYGNPWFPWGEEAVHSKLVLAQIIANFRSVGYKLYASVDISYGTEGRDLETWVFRRVGDKWQ